MSAILIAHSLVNCLDQLTDQGKFGELHRPAKYQLSGEPTGPATVDTTIYSYNRY